MNKNKHHLKIARIFTFIVVLLLSSLTVNVASANTNLPKTEMRAVWISSVLNIDMKAGMSKKDYTTWAQKTLDTVKENKLNTVIFQVRPTNDALYVSKHAPWSTYITGKKQGTNPGYDPLAIMIEEAHKRGIELHAWMNPYRVTMPDQKLTDLAPTNVARKNPTWVVKYGKQYYLNPGLPEVQNYLVETVQELVANYDIDAIHMDDYFYPYKIAKQDFPDSATFKKYGAPFKKIDDWRRHNVNQLVEKLYTTIKETKPYVQFGISPFGVWRNKSVDKTGSDTKAGVNNYDDLYADVRTWIKDGTIDYVTPQIYWSRTLSVAKYGTLLDWWSREVETYANTRPVNLYIGMADYKVGNDSDKAWKNKMELPSQIRANRAATSAASGQMHFSLASMKSNKLDYAAIVKKDLYNYNALTPGAVWLDDHEPAEPTAVEVTKSAKGTQLRIVDDNQVQPRKYVIYRFNGSQEGAYDDSENILDVVYNTDGHTLYLDKTASANKNYTYGIRAISNTGVEGQVAFVVQ